MKSIHRTLIVEDDVSISRAIERALHGVGVETVVAPTVVDALAALRHGFDLIILDVRLPDGSGVTIAEEATRLKPSPLIVAMSGSSSPHEAFRLAQAGVVAFLPKPFTIEQFQATLTDARGRIPRLEPLVSACVGTSNLREVQDEVRRTMVGQAIAMSHGNRSDAARILRVSRQAIQRFLREEGIDYPETPTPPVRATSSAR